MRITGGTVILDFAGFLHSGQFIISPLLKGYPPYKPAGRILFLKRQIDGEVNRSIEFIYYVLVTKPC